MADPNRATKAFVYAVEAGERRRATKAFAYAVEGSATDRRLTKAFVYAIRGEPVGVGEAPVLRVGGITQTTADLSVDPLAEYLSVTYETYLDTAIVDAAIITGPTRFVRPISGLTPSTTYRSRARVERTAGTSPWSEFVVWTTAAPGQDVLRSCPPVSIGHLQNPDGNPPNFPGRGWFTPYAGEPLRGIVTCVLRHNNASHLWDIWLSDDAGASYSLIVQNLESAGILDGDQLERYQFTLDTTALADGMDYRLRATSAIPGDDEEYESLTFAVDNAEEVYAWKHSDEPLDGRFGKMWAPGGSSQVFGVPNGTIWVRGYAGDIGGLANHDWALYADRLIPQCEGGDVTVRYYIWSGEGGFLGLQGRDDTEELHVGAGFFGQGLSTPEKSGLFVGVENPLSWPLGCCDDYLTGTQARAEAGVPSGGTNLDVLTVESGGLTDALAAIRKMYFKALQYPRFASVPKSDFPRQTWRHGPGPGDLPVTDRSCARRYEVYAQRTRVELDPTDDTRVRIRFRLDGPGVDPPASGYWHFDEWCTLAEPLGCGALGLVSRQLTTSTFGAINGVRSFLTWSAKPLSICGPPPEIPEDEPPPFTPPVEGEPCALVLQVFQDDRKTLAWEVGTDVNHPDPYLALPEHYGEQEIDVVHGAASIGQVEVIVIDPSQTVGDQDSGWLTERLSEGGVTAIHGTRCRLIRFISPELGWVVIADGPATNPKMDESYAAYRWTIRDTRETERKIRAFETPDETWLAPVGSANPWGRYTDPDGVEHDLVEPPDVLTGTFRVSTTTGVPLGFVDLRSYWPGPFGSGPFPFNAVPQGTQTVPSDVIVGPNIWPEGINYADIDILGDPLPVLWTWPGVEFLWRPAGSEDPFTVIQPSDLLVEERSYGQPDEGGYPNSLIDGWNAVDSAGRPVIAVTYLLLQGYLADGTYPEHLDSVEIIYRHKGRTTPRTPHHVQLAETEVEGEYEQMTAGEFVQRAYDGEFSPPDPVTGEQLPTGIRYDEAAVLQMVDPIMARIEEPVDDLRSWLEEHVYAPTGWVPALDNDGLISPVSQVPPDPFVGDLDITDEITEPVPDWDAGERIINILTLTYPRFRTLTPQQAEAIDGIVYQDIEHEFVDPASVRIHTEKKVSYTADLFGAPADILGRPILGLTEEPGHALAQDRKLYVFDRFRNGAQIVQVPVMRSLHIHVPELIEHHSATLRAGDWVTVDLSWFPDYVTRRRGMQTGGQVIAINDVDCAWRVLLIEEVLPLPEES